jgi:hypothetical protein
MMKFLRTNVRLMHFCKCYTCCLFFCPGNVSFTFYSLPPLLSTSHQQLFIFQIHHWRIEVKDLLVWGSVSPWICWETSRFWGVLFFSWVLFGRFLGFRECTLYLVLLRGVCWNIKDIIGQACTGVIFRDTGCLLET